MFTLSVLPGLVYAYLLIFARVGTLVMMMPMIGERTTPVRVRLIFALALTLILYPLLQTRMGGVPQTLGGILSALAMEMVVGFTIGLASRMIMSTLQTAGTIVAIQLGLGFAQSVDPTQGQQAILVGNFMTLLGIALMFSTDMHHLFIRGVADSYTIFSPFSVLPIADIGQFALDTIAKGFKVAIQISAPFLALGLIIYFAMGLLSKLVPQLQLMVVGMPLSILLGFGLLMLLMSAMMTWFLGYAEDSAVRFLAPR